MVRALTALIKNAIEAGTPGSVVLAIGYTGAHIRFSVEDQGEGMSDEVLERIAEPFFTTKPAGKGMGLGTFLVQALAERLGGTLEFQSSRDKGTIATLELPTELVRPLIRAAGD
ncbi:MAG: HAMP domain-containing sensor histidine kinase [Bryobacteraceae bacterium]